MASDIFIRCEGLVKIYKVANLEVFALQGLDLQIQRGELLGIVGASGSGKSTLMNILGGLDRPSAGRVWVDGIDLLKLNELTLNRYRSTKVGFVWQQGARNLISYLSALENVKLPIAIGGKGSQINSTKRAEELLETVGLAERRHHRLAEMSGGEQQRVAIAVALANKPTLLLADEPTGEVDTRTANGIFKVFQDLNSQFGLTTIIVSHDQTIARHVNRVVAIRDGKTSSETIRQTQAAVPIVPLTAQQTADGVQAAAVVEKHEEMTFEEVTLLDSAGRLQIPREFLEKHNIKGRVQLEITDDGILIRPAKTVQNESASAGTSGAGENAPAVEPRGLRAFANRLRGRRPS
jgi:ABC-type lipoprotein export system ATPase subunit/bifunctional DNA-binding transcriptional regulator/antitoxin component of YhaV-PrlF toxin-antitoxin module